MYPFIGEIVVRLGGISVLIEISYQKKWGKFGENPTLSRNCNEMSS